jgi:hypothetical protein
MSDVFTQRARERQSFCRQPINSSVSENQVTKNEDLLRAIQHDHIALQSYCEAVYTGTNLRKAS